jgi:YfiH family protein
VDALVTAERGRWLLVYAADCVPLLVLDPGARAAGAVHAGWRGTAAGIASVVLARMRAAFGTEPRRVLAALGPAIGGCCYEVDARVAERMEAQPWWPSASRATGPGRWHLDLRAAVRAQLLAAGVREDRVAAVGGCTACGEALFFSYRRDGRTGRMAAYIALTGS